MTFSSSVLTFFCLQTCSKHWIHSGAALSAPTAPLGLQTSATCPSQGTPLKDEPAGYQTTRRCAHKHVNSCIRSQLHWSRTVHNTRNLASICKLMFSCADKKESLHTCTSSLLLCCKLFIHNYTCLTSRSKF